MGNPEPLFVGRDLLLVAAPRVMKERHIRLMLEPTSQSRDVGHPHRGGWKAVGWNMAATVAELGLAAGSRIDCVFRLRENEHPDFGGTELELVDLRPST
jgi:single-stranded-DNA-specific exonuclease